MSIFSTQNPGFGVGLRTEHYADFLAQKQPVDWLEIITDNFLVDGGRPLDMLSRIRRDYPVVMHGVAMSIGSANGLDLAYLHKVKALAGRVEPLWISDHLCWTGNAQTQLHDLYPLPYTEEAARQVIAHIRQIQDCLGRRFVIENLSSYVGFKHSVAAEWQFLGYVANEADCLLLVDVNNIYVSSVNHGFAALDYLDGLPAQRVQQIHLAGHSDKGDHLIDTHDHPVAQAVWNLYGQACRRFGKVATMIERDDHIPALSELLAELDMARQIQKRECHPPVLPAPPSAPSSAHNAHAKLASSEAADVPLSQVQNNFADYILDRQPEAVCQPFIGTPGASFDPVQAQRLGIYHHAYRARLAEVLADTFTKTTLFLGSDLFDTLAAQFAVAQPPTVRSLNDYGGGFAIYLAEQYPSNPELFELAQLEWDLRHCFASANHEALTLELAQADAAQTWLTQGAPLHPTLLMRPITTNVVQRWHAIDQDAEVPPVVALLGGQSLVVWRKNFQPSFATVDPSEARCLTMLAQGDSIALAAQSLADAGHLSDPAVLGDWLQRWWHDGWLMKAVSPVQLV